MNHIKNAMNSYRNYMRGGLMHAVGADPTRILANGTMEMNWIGKKYSFAKDELMPDITLSLIHI